jgi:hypothetical protein
VKRRSRVASARCGTATKDFKGAWDARCAPKSAGRRRSRSSRSGNQQIYVLANGVGWSQYPNTYREGDDLGDPLSPPPGYFAPVRGFGKVWRTTPAVESSLGWGTTPEAPMTGVYQRFERGTMLYAWNVNGHGRQIYVLFGDGSFDVFPDPNA